MTSDPEVDAILAAFPAEIRDLPGVPLYSGRDAWTGQSDVYLLGINPGDDKHSPVKDPPLIETAAVALSKPRWSNYDEPWRDGDGQTQFQRNVKHLLKNLDDLDPKDVPSSNLAFVRSNKAADIDIQAAYRLCWPFHATMIERLGVKVVLCLGKSVSDFVQVRLGAHTEVDRHVAPSGKPGHLTSITYTGPGPAVVRLPHPSNSWWMKQESDPSPLVQRALAVARAQSGA